VGSALGLVAVGAAIAIAIAIAVSVQGGWRSGGAPRTATGTPGEPTSSPLVTGVGGTTFSVRRDGGYGSESAWDEDHGPHPSSGAALFATGGGFSARYARPGYQNGLSVTGNYRGVPDVAAVADPGIEAAKRR
jgi:kumamolisin